MWDVTDTEVKTLCTLTISTHTSRVGCDAALPAAFVVSADFYSHIPCGMWQKMRNILVHIVRFLLTHPVWDVTFVFLLWKRKIDISTHTSRVGCDVMICFNVKPFHISTHTSRVGCDGPYGMETTCVETFYSHIPCGMWRTIWNWNYLCRKFLLTHPVWDVTLT